MTEGRFYMQWLNITHKKHPTKKDHSRHESVLAISAKDKFGRYWERHSPEEEVKHRAAGLGGGGLGMVCRRKAIYSAQNACLASAPGRRSDKLTILNSAHTTQSPQALPRILPGPNGFIIVATAQTKP